MSTPKVLASIFAVAAFCAGAADESRLRALQGEEPAWWIIAHRAGRLEFDENTLGAFRGCYECGLRAFETDIRMTRDGVLVVAHDSTLKRVFNGTGTVEEMTAADLKRVRTWKTDQPMLFLDELLAFFTNKPGVMILFEMKTDPKLYPEAHLEHYCRKLHDAVTAGCPRGSLYIFSSGDRRALRYFQEHYPKTERQLISSNSRVLESIHEARALGIRRFGCALDESTRATVREVRKAGMIITGGYANSRADYLLAVALGVDNVISDTPVAVFAGQSKAP